MPVRLLVLKRVGGERVGLGLRSVDGVGFDRVVDHVLDGVGFDRVVDRILDDVGLDRVVDRVPLADEVAAPGFRGCPFVNTYAEFPDPSHPAHRVAVDGVNHTRARLQEIAERASADDPSTLADRLMLIIDGLYANGAVLGINGAAASGVAFARDLVEAATRPSRAGLP